MTLLLDWLLGSTSTTMHWTSLNKTWKNSSCQMSTWSGWISAPSALYTRRNSTRWSWTRRSGPNTIRVRQSSVPDVYTFVCFKSRWFNTLINTIVLLFKVSICSSWKRPFPCREVLCIHSIRRRRGMWVSLIYLRLSGNIWNELILIFMFIFSAFTEEGDGLES